MNASPGLRVADPRTEHLRLPLGVDEVRPHLSWRLESPDRDVRQSAYRVRVASSAEALAAGGADLWDSGRVESSESVGVVYAGAEPASRQRCWWSVEVWDASGRSAESDAVWWEMGLREAGDWTAEWLAVEDEVRRADREAGLHWVWGSEPERGGLRRFRHAFEVAGTTTEAQLLVVVNDWSWGSQITGVWFDGVLIAGEGRTRPTADREWLGKQDFDVLTAQRLELGALAPGRHVVAVEVDAKAGTDTMAFGRVPGLTLFARLTDAAGRVDRVTSRTGTRVSTTDDADWAAPDYDDAAWEDARPAPVEDYQPWPAEPALRFRREFDVPGDVVRARLYATALGAYEARLNGERVGDALFTPEISQYEKRVMYQAYDVTDQVRPGRNAFGLEVADGWFASTGGRYAWTLPPRRVIAQLELELADGSRRTVGTDGAWRVGPSPVVSSTVKGGEAQDRRKHEPGWDVAGFDDGHWTDATPTAGPDYRPTAQPVPPIRVIETVAPRTVTEVRPGVQVIDFGVNLVGWCRLRVPGAEGTELVVRYGELLHDDGGVNQENQWDPVNLLRTDRFVLGAEPEVLEPAFSFRSFQYVEVSGLAGPLPLDAVEAVFAHTDVDVTGDFTSDSTLLEKMWHATLQTQRSNFVAIPTDNNMRESRGWMNDGTAVFWDTAAFNMDVYAFTARFMESVRDDQGADGAFPMVTPEPNHNNTMYNTPGSPPAWGDTGVMLPWFAWQRYGDRAIIERNWDAMRRHVGFILDHNPDLIWNNARSADFGEWLEYGMVRPDEYPRTPRELLGTAYWAHSLDLLSQMSRAIGRDADADELDEVHGRVRAAFQAEFVRPDGVGNGTQGGDVFAIQFGLLPDDAARTAAVERLAADIRGRGGWITTGTVATQFVLDILADGGHIDLAYDLLLRTEHPSWGYSIERGATTIWEYWNGRAIGDDGYTSQNQFAFGSFGGFLFRRVAGIAPAVPGFAELVVKPLLDPRVRRAGARYDSIRGPIASSWTRDGDGLALDLEVPANVTARVHLPVGADGSVTEGGRALAVGAGVRAVERGAAEAVVEVGSGSYRFVV